MKDLGGRRKTIREDSPHIALRNSSFRNYADYMLTDQFQNAAEALVKMAEQSPTAYMCAERVYFHCHRMLVSDWLTATAAKSSTSTARARQSRTSCYPKPE